MNVGLVNIYAFRPHVEHLYFLSEVLKKDGHNTHFLTCDATLSSCYPRALKQSSKVSECSKCILGGVRSYPVKQISSIANSYSSTLSNSTLNELALSSACTLHRTESEDDYDLEEVKQTIKELSKPISVVYESTVDWIQKNQLDAVIVFNGRMDATRAITFACERLSVPFITHERSWFGDGLRLNPGANCLSIRHVDKLVREYDSKPLTFEQSMLAAKHLAQRFLQANKLEWRLYNANPEPAKWPLSSPGKKILVIPSSKNEFAGHPEWKSGWKSNTQALEDYMEAFDIKPEQVIVRCHPNWSENIGAVTGEKSQQHYSEWAASRGVHVINSDSKLSTYDLIQQADIVIMNGGSSAVEAGACGKEVVCLGPSPYMSCGFVKTFLNQDDLSSEWAGKVKTKTEIIQSTLRYMYLRARRFPQYVDNVIANTTTDYSYYEGADSRVLIDMFKSEVVEAYDKEFGASDEAELKVVEKVRSKEWRELTKYEPSIKLGPSINISRKKSLKFIDYVRSKIKRGDR
ncbi:capsule biosynthesis protein [Kangiella geojedonensis]|uniref:Capsule biosynthesis protein n=1 Tax=Kangiella geojedonensis TaxID=914150 RepID=A0A0F6TQV9_9GAMM|nr:capsule biosynthesis protein [Kangiella geojedonensis]AKE52347.1 capsule biosynthesis protein [Kangiella geojedonensis]